MKIIYQIPRNSLVWLLTAQVAVIIPHISRIPWWLTAISFACAFWRIQVFRGLWRFPGKMLRFAFVLIGAAGVLYSFGTILGAPAGVALLIMAFSFKLLEMHTLRDAFLVVLLSYFVIAMNFLFEQSMSHAFYGAICFLIVTAAMLGLNQSRSHWQPFRTFKTSGLIILQSIPLMIVLFILVPRFGPLWTLDFGNSNSYTGLSETMTPGDIASLSKSPKLAFRASFEQDIPDNRQLYWRTLMLYDFDGRTWRAGSPNDQSKNGKSKNDSQHDPEYSFQWLHDYQQNFYQDTKTLEAIKDTIKKPEDKPVYNYQVIMEPTGQNYIFALDMPFSEKGNLILTRDYLLRNKEPIFQRFDYSLMSIPGLETDIKLPDYLREKATALPKNSNHRSRALAQKWRSQARTDEEYINKILYWFNQKNFVYTLRPPLLGRHSVDEFFFDTQRGFCAHYAGAFAFLLRSVNIPVRVVAGYQGGEINTLGNYVLVHQFDAHAWVEVWLKNRGWVRFDPTGAVSPLRVERGIEDALSDEDSFLEGSFFSASRYRKIPLIGLIRLRLDYINYLWHTKVVGYQSQQQFNLITKWFGVFSYEKIALALIISGMIIMGFLALILFFKRPIRKIDPATKLYLKYCKKLQNAGYPRLPGESPRDYGVRVSTARPNLKSTVERITTLYIALAYTDKLQNENQKHKAMNSLSKAIRKIQIS